MSDRNNILLLFYFYGFKSVTLLYSGERVSHGSGSDSHLCLMLGLVLLENINIP